MGTTSSPDAPKVAPRAIGVHIVHFERNRITHQWRAFCSCGWSCTGDADAVKTRAATHDLDEAQ